MDEVQGPAVQPGDDEVFRAIDRGLGQALGAGAQSQSGGARVLGLDGEQAAHQLGGPQPLGAVQQLGGGAGARERGRDGHRNPQPKGV